MCDLRRLLLRGTINLREHAIADLPCPRPRIHDFLQYIYKSFVIFDFGSEPLPLSIGSAKTTGSLEILLSFNHDTLQVNRQLAKLL
ncbi:hypothetical protein BJV77DRAFT_989699 [Russula vinacea]|nr:hypothetical protein BJV77DRAFT_989699 [Russula vinacea]